MSNLDARWLRMTREELETELAQLRQYFRILEGTRHATWCAQRAATLDTFIRDRRP